MTPEIDIGTVLNKFDDTADEASQDVKTYGIRFLKANGEVREMTCRKNVKSPKQQPVERNPRGKQVHHLKTHGNMMLHDVDADKAKTVKVATIFAFRDWKSDVWYKVWH